MHVWTWRKNQSRVRIAPAGPSITFSRTTYGVSEYLDVFNDRPYPVAERISSWAENLMKLLIIFRSILALTDSLDNIDNNNFNLFEKLNETYFS